MAELSQPMIFLSMRTRIAIKNTDFCAKTKIKNYIIFKIVYFGEGMKIRIKFSADKNAIRTQFIFSK